MKPSIYQYSLKKLEQALAEKQVKKFLAKQIFNWVYQKQISNFNQMINVAKTNQKILQDTFEFNELEIVFVSVDSDDLTTKILFKLRDGQTIETVIMRFNYGDSICLTTQVGCNMGCKFCASGTLKKVRDLTVDEIILQYLLANKYWEEKYQRTIRHIVVMGIGEPFDNFENLSDALDILIDQYGLGIGQRHITVSTCGLCDKILVYAKKFPQLNLAISLHASNNDIRNQLMPINHRYKIEDILRVLEEYWKITNRRVTIEYILIDGVNDSLECARELVQLFKNKLCYINLIPFNKVSHCDYRRSKNVNKFFQFLQKNRLFAAVRLERGKNIAAACGQLKANYDFKKRR